MTTFQAPMQYKENTPYYILLIIIVSFFAFFINNQVVPADLMESRNLATAQEMVREGNYLVPTMNGDLRLEKPPLPTWIAAGVELLSPGNLILQRYMAGLSATIMGLFLFFLVSRLTNNRKIGLIAAIIMATTFNIAFMGRTATWDIYCHSFMLGAIYFMVLAIEKCGAQWKWFIVSGIFLGLSFLSKGPVSFYALLLPFLIAYFITFRPSMKGKWGSLISMIIVFIIVSFWWPVYILMFHSEIATAVANKESSSWLNHNVRSFYYYWQFPAEAGIWALFWVTSLIYYFWKRPTENRSTFKFSIIWTFTALILLSLIPEKKTRYLLPMLIPGSINIAFYIYYTAKSKLTKAEKVVFRINTTLIALILLALPIILYIFFVKENLLSIPVFAITAAICILLAMYMLYSTYAKRSPFVMQAFSCVIFTMMLVTGLCMIPIGHMFINEERHSIRMLRDNKEVEGIPFYYNQEDEYVRMELVYEANKTIRPLDITDTTLIMEKLPFVYVSRVPIDSTFIGKEVNIRFIDKFDNNWRKSEHKRYNKDLVSYVAIITKKTE